MKQPGTVLHEHDEEFLVIEGGYSADTRALNLLARPTSALFPRDEELKPVSWGDQGDWFPVARWSVGASQFYVPSDEEHREAVDATFERYLHDHEELDVQAWVPLDAKKDWLASLEKVIPMGLVVSVYDEEESAHEAEGAQGVLGVTNLAVMLSHLAREGYAGALLSGREPIFFCIDDDSELQFLRLRRGDGKVQMDILRVDGDWDAYEGAEEIEFLDNREACDARLVDTYGEDPIHGWPEDDRFWSVGPLPDEPGTVIAPEDELPYLLAFADKLDAEAWIEDSENPWIVLPVDDLMDFLDRAEGSSAALLNPGAHRLRSGVVWIGADGMVLDSFSGFWHRREGSFERAS